MSKFVNYRNRKKSIFSVRFWQIASFIFYLLIATPAFAQWTTGQFGTGTNTTNNLVQVVKDNSQTFHGCWHPQSTNFVFRSWNGSSWTTITSFDETNISDATQIGGESSFAVDGNGAYHVAFEAYDYTATPDWRGIWYGIYNGSWSFTRVEAYQDASGWKSADKPDIDVDGFNNPHIVFDYTDSNDPDKHILKYAHKISPASSFTVLSLESVDPSSSSMDISYAHIAMDGSTARISYMKNTGGSSPDDQLWLGTYSGSWSSAAIYTGVANEQSIGESHYLVLDSSGNVHIAFYSFINLSGSDNDQRRINYITNASGSWVNSVLVSNTNYPRLRNKVGLDINNSGNMAISYGQYNTQPDPREYQARVGAKIGSDPWAFETAYTNNPNQLGNYNSISIDNSNRVMTLFHCTTGTPNPRTAWYAIKTFSASAAPVFNDGESANLSVNEGQSNVSINSLLGITDTDSGETLTWSPSSNPTNGSLGGFNATGTSNGGVVTPTGLTYTHDSSDTTTDSFVIQISDGADTDTITISVIVTPVNDPPTDIGLSNNSVNENQPAGATVGTLSTTDPDN